jgi:hypothetical protein
VTAPLTPDAWQTPLAGNAKGTDYARYGENGLEPGRLHALQVMARTVVEPPTAAPWPTPTGQDDNKSPEAHLAMKQRMGERDGTGANRTAITSLQVMARTVVEPPTAAPWPTPRQEDSECSGARVSRGTNDTLTAVSRLTEPPTEPASWGTSTSQDSKHGVMSPSEAARDPNVLRNQVHQAPWPTPIANDAEKLGVPVVGSGLAVTSQLSNWPTPTGQDAVGSGSTQPPTETHHSGTTLTDAAKLATVDETPGPTSSGSLAGTAKPARPRLNPAFSRWLMGFPEVWDECVPTPVKKSKKRS